MRKIFYLFAIIFVTCGINLYSNNIPPYMQASAYLDEDVKIPVCNHHPKPKIDKILSEMESAIVRRPYDVLKYDLLLDWTNPLSSPLVVTTDSSISGYDTTFDDQGNITKIDTIWDITTFRQIERNWNGLQKMTVRIDSANMDKLVLNSMELKINIVKINNQEVTFELNKASEELIINLPSTYPVGEELTIEIAYEFDYVYDQGFWLSPENTYVGISQAGDSVFTEDRLAYTMSEPQDARYWMPCNDAPYDKAVATISVRIPKGFQAVSNGLLKEIKSEDTTHVYIWEDDTPITTYLMAVTASNFKQFSDFYHKVTNPNDSIEVQYYVWEADYLQDSVTDGSQYNATWSFRKTVDMMEFYSGLIGEYPFKKYGMVAIQPFVFGGMEHQTITSINRSWLRGSWFEGGIAHELFHQWFGDQITCATWDDIWINEGGATFGQALWTEYQAGRPAYDQEMAFNRWNYIRRSNLFDVPIYGINVDWIFWTHSDLVYEKASWVYHMLREMLGEEAFYSVLRKMLIDNSFNSIETRDFERTFTESIPNPKIPFDIYFKQWIYGGGHPLYNINTNVHIDQSNNYSADVTLKQRQQGETVAEVFHAPVMLKFFNETGELIHSEEVINTQREQTFNINLPAFPDSVAIDQTLLLCEVFDNIVSVKEETEPGNIANEVYPNPLKVGETGKLGIALNRDSEIRSEIFDPNGARVADVYEGYLSQGTYTLSFATSGLSRGVYLLKVFIGGKIIIKKFTVAE